MLSIRMSTTWTLVLVVGAAPGAASAACETSRSTYSLVQTLPNAAAHIACLEATLSGGVGTGTGVSAVPGWKPTSAPLSGPKPRGPAYLELEAYLKWMYAQYEWTDDAWVLGFAPTLPDNAKVLLARPEQDAVRWQQWQVGNTWADVMVVTPDGIDLAPDLTNPEIMRKFMLDREANQFVSPGIDTNEGFVTDPGVIDFGGFDGGGGGYGGM